ncbi:Ger(x)C family spore germination protein [Paenibacillus sp. 1001270B_150601_E10]|uniref:Ger(x)C family spore germination protein n=1 Tax=Paenibacillus sp. 1001270B_150601_E10 TaxID=2787079 RepID=UPI002B4BC3D9|nr:Ger(x)C family spore germination protein [Paenibacillus sp. 1001270B_150601_E10]
MAKSIQSILMSICVLLVLTGCWNRREMNDLLIAAGMGVDKVDGGYLVSVQVVDPSEITEKKGGGYPPVTVYSETGETVFEAVRKMTKVAARKIYFSHLRLFVIGEETAKTDGIANAAEFLFRDHELRVDYYIAIARNSTAKEILSGLSTIEKIPAEKLFTSLEMSSRSYAATETYTIDDLVSDLVTEGKSPAITGIMFIGDKELAGKKENLETTDPYTKLKYEGIAVFHGDKMVGWLNDDESKGYNYLTGRSRATVIAVPCPEEDGELSIELIRTKSHVQVNHKDQSLQLNIKVEAEGNVGEVQCRRVDLTNLRTINQLQTLTAEAIEDKVEKTLQKVIQLNTDFVGFGMYINRASPNTWEKYKDNWGERLGSIPVTVKASVKLRNTGKTDGSFLQKIKE